MDLQVRVSAPAAGENLPVILFSHGNGQSLHAYGPLADQWAARGFVVIQPTHLDSRMLALGSDDPRRSQFWRFREDDLIAVLDGLDGIEDGAAMIRGRLDRARIAVAGHSWGGQTASTLLGAKHPDPEDGSVVDRRDARVKAGVLLATPGSGLGLTEHAARTFPFMYPDFSTMTTPTLVVAGDQDMGRLSTRGADWWRDAYDLSPSPKALFTAFGGEHSLGGIPDTRRARRPTSGPGASPRSSISRPRSFAAPSILAMPPGRKPSQRSRPTLRRKAASRRNDPDRFQSPSPHCPSRPPLRPDYTTTKAKEIPHEHDPRHW